MTRSCSSCIRCARCSAARWLGMNCVSAEQPCSANTNARNVSSRTVAEFEYMTCVPTLAMTSRRHSTDSVRAGGRRTLRCVARPRGSHALAPRLVRNDCELAYEHGEQNADWRERLVREARDGYGHTGVTRYRCEGEHGPIIFARTTEEMPDRETDE